MYYILLSNYFCTYRSYIGSTVHWLDAQTLQQFSKKGLVCGKILGEHTYNNIAESIDKILGEFKIQNKTTLIVTDNAANFVKAFRYLHYNLLFLA